MGILALTTETLTLVFSNLGFRDLCQAKQVCRAFRICIEDDKHGLIWRGASLREGLRPMSEEERSLESYEQYLKRNWTLCNLADENSDHLQADWLIGRIAQAGHSVLLCRIARKRDLMCPTVLTEAAGYGLANVVESVMSSADFSKKIKEDYKTSDRIRMDAVLARAVNRGQLEIVKLILESHHFDNDEIILSVFLLAIVHGHTAIVRYFLSVHCFDPEFIVFAMSLARFLKHDDIFQLLYPSIGDVHDSLIGIEDEERIKSFLSEFLPMRKASWERIGYREWDEELCEMGFPLLSNSEMIGEVLKYGIENGQFSFFERLLNHPNCAPFILEENFFHTHLSEQIVETYNHHTKAMVLVNCLAKKEMIPFLESTTRFSPCRYTKALDNHLDILLPVFASCGYASFVGHILKCVNPDTLPRRIAKVFSCADGKLTRLLLQHEQFVDLLCNPEIIDEAIKQALEEFCLECYLLRMGNDQELPRSSLYCCPRHSSSFEQLLRDPKCASFILEEEFFHTHLSEKIIKTDNPQFIAICLTNRKMRQLLEIPTRFRPFKNHIDCILSIFASESRSSNYNKLVINVLKHVAKETLSYRILLVLRAAKIENIDLAKHILQHCDFEEFLDPAQLLHEFAFRGQLELVELLLQNRALEMRLTKEEIDLAGCMLQTRLRINEGKLVFHEIKEILAESAD